ncbi:hypothetical protein FACS1894206_02500 [Deltaproteobacteria bacterium]|nr:hypothetical protein FACS1894206_02500 [Deltaproteobacteria bacterium]
MELLLQDPAKIDALYLRKGKKNLDTDKIIDLCRENGIRFSLVDDAFLGRLWSGNHQGVIARLFTAGFMDYPDLLKQAADAPLPLLLAFDEIQDVGNAGALARTLYAMGGAGIVSPRHNGVYFGSGATKVSAGALNKLSVAKVANLAQALDLAREANYTVYGACSDNPAKEEKAENAFLFSPRLPAVLVLGNEEKGIRPIVKRRCSSLLSIPFAREFDSLNVAQAGAILISAFAASLQK